MNPNLTFQNVEAEVRRLARKEPERVYRPPAGMSCRYLHTDPNNEDAWIGGCIFGHAFLNLGIEPEVILRWEGNTCEALIEVFGISMTDRQKMWATGLQSLQDADAPWGQCILQADNLYPLENEQ